jgi:hypothetical protein
MVGERDGREGDLQPFEFDKRELLEALLRIVTVQDATGNSAFWGDVRLKRFLMRFIGAEGANLGDETIEGMSSFNTTMRNLRRGNQDLRSIILEPVLYRVAADKDRRAYAYCINSFIVRDRDNKKQRSPKKSSRGSRSSGSSSTDCCSCRGGEHEVRCQSFVFSSPPSFWDISDELLLSFKLADGPADGGALQWPSKPGIKNIFFQPAKVSFISLSVQAVTFILLGGKPTRTREGERHLLVCASYHLHPSRRQARKRLRGLWIGVASTTRSWRASKIRIATRPVISVTTALGPSKIEPAILLFFL